jgi:hypothetical protein
MGGIFSHCFPHCEIPHWFCHQSNGHSVRIPLPPPYLFDNSGLMGFAICAVFSFHKHPTAVRMNLDSTLPHGFMCRLETNLGCVCPLLSHSIREDEVLISIYQRAFLWVLFIPRRGAFAQQITWAKFSFLSDSPDVSVLRCGASLVDRQNMDEFNRTIVQLITSGVASLNAIRSSCKEGAVCERLPIYHNKIGGFEFEDPQSRPLRLPSSPKETTPRNRFPKTSPLVRILMIHTLTITNQSLSLSL